MFSAVHKHASALVFILMLAVNTGGAEHKMPLLLAYFIPSDREEVKAALSREGIDADPRTLVIFQVLLEGQGGKALEVGPCFGGGTHLAGTAWVYNDALLDPRRLSSTEACGFYHQLCSIGEFNSHYIGGVAHELGHAFGLPSCGRPEVDLKAPKAQTLIPHRLQTLPCLHSDRQRALWPQRR